jgi:hypothetical protein
LYEPLREPLREPSREPLREPLTRGAAVHEMASAVALKATVPANSSRTFRFVVAWYAPELSSAGKKDNRTYCGTTDVNRMYHNRFSGATGLEEMLRFVATPAVRTALEVETVAWQVCITPDAADAADAPAAADAAAAAPDAALPLLLMLRCRCS